MENNVLQMKPQVSQSSDTAVQQNVRNINMLIQRLMASTWNNYYWRVIEFNHDGGNQMGQEWLSPEQADTEIRILSEEVDELKNALNGLKKVKINGETQWIPASDKERRIEVCDAIADIIYVALGTAGKLGIDLPKALDEVASSNESKYDENHKLSMVNGKIQKGNNFVEPNLSFANEVFNFSEQVEYMRNGLLQRK